MDQLPQNITPDQSYLIGEILKNRVQADYDHWTITLVAGVPSKLPGQWNYAALIDVVDGAGAVPAIDVVSLSWNASTFRVFPRGLFIRIPTPVNGWLEVVSTINCTVKIVVGIGEIRDSRLIPPSGGVPVVPVAGSCFPIELCPGDTSLPVSLVAGSEVSQINLASRPNNFFASVLTNLGYGNTVLFAAQPFDRVLYGLQIMHWSGDGVGFGSEGDSYVFTNGLFFSTIYSGKYFNFTGARYEVEKFDMAAPIIIPALCTVNISITKTGGAGNFISRVHASIKG